MNYPKLTNIIRQYKLYFPEIHKEEIYKWRAVRNFQDHWDINARNFPLMLEQSLSGAKNLLASGVYYPKRMVVNNAVKEPELLRSLFRDLFDESINWDFRVAAFKAGFKTINDSHYPGKNHYQDERAILVYLCLRYPEKYFFYKFEMFKQFAALVDHNAIIKRGYIQNIKNYHDLCKDIKSFVDHDPELLRLHEQRLTGLEYHDANYHILTQDIIYAATTHIERFQQEVDFSPAAERLVLVPAAVEALAIKPVLTGTITDHEENQSLRRWLGNLGEKLVFEYEKQVTQTYSVSGEVIHASKVWGDGLGYDILSFDENGDLKYIEVKTTSASIHAPFFVTANELACSIQNNDDFCLYRLYHYDTANHTAHFYIWQGSLQPLCVNPVLFKIVTEANDEIDSNQHID